MFLLYSVYRSKYSLDFHEAAKELHVALGAANTVILLTSSLTIALSIAYVRNGKKKQSLMFQTATILLGFAFLVNKYFEWGAKIQHGLYPNSPELLAHPKGEILFYGLYYVMTGLHGLHVLIGMAILCFLLVFTAKDIVNEHSFIKLENGGLYWHLVDLIWIYLFPLFYLIT